MLRVEDRNLTYNCLLLQIVTWMESCLIGTHLTSSYIYFQINLHALVVTVETD